MPLGLILLAEGHLTHAQLRNALRLQGIRSKKLGEILIGEGYVSERRVNEALGLQWGCPAWDIAGVRPDRLGALVPRAVLQSAGMVPVRLVSQHPSASPAHLPAQRLMIAFAGDPQAQALLALQRMHDLAVEAGIVPLSQWSRANDRLESSEAVPCEMIFCEELSTIESMIVRTLRRVQPIESRLVRVNHLFWLRTWLEPAALSAGPLQIEDVTDFLYQLPTAANA